MNKLFLTITISLYIVGCQNPNVVLVQQVLQKPLTIESSIGKVRVPIIRSKGGCLFILAEVDKEKCILLLDTAVEAYLCLPSKNMAEARNLAAIELVGVGSRKGGLGVIPQFTIGDLLIKDMPTVFADIAFFDESEKSNRSQERMSGVLGSRFLAYFDCNIDYANNVLILNPPAKNE